MQSSDGGPNTAHVAVVDLPPFSLPLHPALVSHHSVRMSAAFVDTVSGPSRDSAHPFLHFYSFAPAFTLISQTSVS